MISFVEKNARRIPGISASAAPPAAPARIIAGIESQPEWLPIAIPAAAPVRAVIELNGGTAAQLGIVTRQVNDPTRALETFVEFKPDFVLLDVFMPEVDGIDVLHEILLTAIPTRIVLTSGAGEELLDVGREAMRFHGAGEAIVLAKPFRRAELVEVLTRLMN